MDEIDEGEEGYKRCWFCKRRARFKYYNADTMRLTFVCENHKNEVDLL